MNGQSNKSSANLSRSGSKNELILSDTSTESSDDDTLDDEEEEMGTEPRPRIEHTPFRATFFNSYVNPPEGLPPPTIPYEPPLPTVQQIFGQKETEEDPLPTDQVYYTKWTGYSFIHCSYECREDLEKCIGGDNALRKFANKQKVQPLSQSLSFPELNIADPDELNAAWFEVDRVIAHEEGKYFIKWRGLSYDQCTWELPEDVPVAQIEEFEKRKEHFNMITVNLENQPDPNSFTKIEEPLEDKNGNTLRDYQLEGLNWLRYCWFNKRNSILADEMGLGKTVQIVSTLVDIANNHRIRGPFLILAPLSTLGHWKKEFENWSDLNAVVYHGNAVSKEVIQRYEMCYFDANGMREMDKVAFDVIITNYETFMTDFDVFNKIEWRYLVLDEGHRLKNHTGKCYQLLQQLHFAHCTLLTGTPIQNNVEELWSLLHFLHPDSFPDVSTFMEEFGTVDNAETLEKLQETIRPYLLRRKKCDVETTIAAKEETIIEVELTRTQKTFYRALLDSNASVLLSQITTGALPSLQNLMMQLRKVCNHPFLIRGALESIEAKTRETMPPGTPDADISLKALVESSGKLILIDKLLPKLKADGHKVLIFSQMVKVLDILEEYMHIKEYNCERIDGSVPENDRQAAIERFGVDPNAFVFLLCTRAGGVGINLTAADTVIIYDSDWNPQNDVQAQSRCHRIGQTQLVKVYRLVTRGTYELEMLDRASKKLGLDHALLDGGEIKKDKKMEAREIEKLLRRGVYDIAKDDDTEIDKFCAQDIDQILDSRSKKFSRDATDANSQFSKAKFDAEQDSLDLKAKDFWSQVLPNMKMQVEEPLKERRCRQIKTVQVDSDDGDDDEPRRRKGSHNSGVRQYIKEIQKHGYSGTAGERFVLFEAAAGMQNMDPTDRSIIMGLLKIADFDDKPEEIINMEEKYASGIKECQDKATAIIGRTMLFYNLSLILTAAKGPLRTWPTSGVDEDPLFEYSLMYSVATKGFVDNDKVFEGTGFHTDKPLPDKFVVKSIKHLVKALGPITNEVDMIDREYMLPMDWKEAHQNLFNRTLMSNEEYTMLFQIVVSFGIPEAPHVEGEAPHPDFERIHKISGMKCVNLDTITEAVTEFQDLARDELLPQQQQMVLKRLGDYGNRIWLKKLRDNMRDLKRIRFFAERIGDEEKELIAKVRTFENAPDWWESKHDIYLLQSIAKYGLVYVTVFILDPEGPFAEHVPASAMEAFKAAAEVEMLKARPNKPRDAGDFSELYNDRKRMGRINTIISYVETRQERIARYNAGDDIDTPISTQVPIVTELPELPLDLGQQLTICEFGRFEPGHDSYPVGYVSRRQYFSLNEPTEKAWYEASTRITDDDKFQFVVKFMEDPYTEFVSHTASGAWEALIQEIQKERGKRGLPRRKHTTVSGPFMYGFTHQTVVPCLQFLRNRDQ